MSRINIMREIKNNKKKEEGWNDRFIFGRIEDYKNNKNYFDINVREVKKNKCKSAVKNKKNSIIMEIIILLEI